MKTSTGKNGKHLILDIDETLVHTFSANDKFEDFISELSPEQTKRAYFLEFESGEGLAGYIRPYVEEFLKAAFEEFETVSVWSAGTYEYVHGLVKRIFKDDIPAPHFIMTRQDCNEIKLGYNNEYCRYKPLEIIYRKHKTHTPENTLIIDDRDDICALNCLNNVRIPEFYMNSNNWKKLINDEKLIALANWFKTHEFKQTKDVRKLKSKSPFKIEL